MFLQAILFFVAFSQEEECVDTDNGALDSWGDACEDYYGFPEWCGPFDDDDFTANEMCCACKLPDDSPPPIGKGSIQCGSRFTDSVSEPNEVHRYEFTASTTAIAFDSCGSEELDTILRILDADGGQLFINDDHDERCPGGTHVASHIDATGLEVGATYFLEVKAYGANIGGYEIFLECVDTPEEEAFSWTFATTGDCASQRFGTLTYAQCQTVARELEYMGFDPVVQRGIFVNRPGGCFQESSYTLIYSDSDAASSVTCDDFHCICHVGQCTSYDAVVVSDASSDVIMTTHAQFGGHHEVLNSPARRTDPWEACTALNNDLTGYIAVASRGTCYFSTKALHAQRAGASAIIILNDGRDDPGVMSCGGDCSEIHIPVVFINNAHVEPFLDVLDSDPDHIWHLGCGYHDWDNTHMFTIEGDDCEIVNDCVTSFNYPNEYWGHDECTITANRDLYIQFNQVFEIEDGFDILTVAETPITAWNDPNAPDQLLLGQEIHWKSDESYGFAGWEVCFFDEPIVPDNVCTMSESNYLEGKSCPEYMVAEVGSWDACEQSCLANPDCFGIQVANDGRWDCSLVISTLVQNCPAGNLRVYPKNCIQTQSQLFDVTEGCEVFGDCVQTANFPLIHGRQKTCTITAKTNVRVSPADTYSQSVTVTTPGTGSVSVTVGNIPEVLQKDSQIVYQPPLPINLGWKVCFAENFHGVCPPNTVQHGCTCYATFDYASCPADTEYGDCPDVCNGEFKELPAGWSLAEYTEDVLNEVVHAHQFGTHFIVFGNGDAYGAGTFDYTGQVLENQLQMDANGWYKVECQGYQAKILITRELDSCSSVSRRFSVIGDCEMSGDCVSSNNYPANHGSNEECTVTALQNSRLRPAAVWEIEQDYDELYINGVNVQNSHEVPARIDAGVSFHWSSDESLENPGWKICFDDVRPSEHPEHEEWFHVSKDCEIQGACVQSNNYPNAYGNDEKCTVNVMKDAFLLANSVFQLDAKDSLVVGGVDVTTWQNTPARLTVGETIEWETDAGDIRTGWQICFSDEPVGSDFFTVSGTCEVRGDCVSSSNYPSYHDPNEDCTVTVRRAAQVRAGSEFAIETCCDHLFMNAVDVDRSEHIVTRMDVNDVITWTSDISEQHTGWQLCFSEPPQSDLYNLHGDCVSVGDCVTTPNYPREYPFLQHCEIELVEDVTISARDTFDVETSDYIQFGDLHVTNKENVPEMMPAGETILWGSDHALSHNGWKLCFAQGESLFSVAGNCDVQNDYSCVSSGNYPASYDSNEDCQVTINEDVYVTTGSLFQITDTSLLEVPNGNMIGYRGDLPQTLSAGDTISWTTSEDESMMMAGWQLCFSKTPPSNPNTDAYFDVVNGPCEVQGGCISSSGYPSQYAPFESCDIVVLKTGLTNTSLDWGIEDFHDKLTMGEAEVHRAEEVPDILVAGTRIAWSSDGTTEEIGWQICLSPMREISCGDSISDETTAENPEAVFSFVASAPTIDFSSCATLDFDTILQVMDLDMSVVYENDDHSNHCDDNWSASHIAANLDIGSTYFVKISGWQDDHGPYTIDMECGAMCTAHDHCSVGTFCAGGSCEPCNACDTCEDGIDNTCGACGDPPSESCTNVLCGLDAAYHNGPMVNEDADADTAQECQQACASDVECRYWDFGEGYCRLRSDSGEGGAEHHAGYIFGTKYCQFGETHFGTLYCGSQFRDSTNILTPQHEYDFVATHAYAEFSACGATFDSQIIITDENGVHVHENDEHGGLCGDDANWHASYLVVEDLIVGQTYTLTIKGYENDHVGAYDISMECGFTFADRFYYNGDCEHYINGNGDDCVSSQGYPTSYGGDQSCSVTVSMDSMVSLDQTFGVHATDSLTVAGLHITSDNYNGEGMWPHYMLENKKIIWETSQFNHGNGWAMCFSEAVVPVYEMRSTGKCDSHFTQMECEAIANDMGLTFYWSSEPNVNYPSGCIKMYELTFFGILEHIEYNPVDPSSPDCDRDDQCVCPVTSCQGTPYEVFVQADSHADEISWSIAGTTCSGATGQYSPHTRYNDRCCLEDGDYTLECHDSYGDGWNENVIKIGDVVFCHGSGFTHDTSMQFKAENGVITPVVQCDTSTITVELQTSLSAHNVYWSVQGGTQSCDSAFESYEDYQTYEKECCLPDGDYRLVCENTDEHLGWRGGSINIGGFPFCHDFLGSQISLQSFTIVNGAVSAPGVMTTPTPIECSADQTSFSIILETGIYGDEVTWQLETLDGNFEPTGEVVCQSDADMLPYPSDTTIASSCCIPNAVYKLSCIDSFGDGWDGAHIFFNEYVFCQEFQYGYQADHGLEFFNGAITTVSLIHCDEDEDSIDVEVIAMGWGFRQSWSLVHQDRPDDDPVCGTPQTTVYDDYTSTFETCCIPDGIYTLTCKSYGFGWDGGSVSFQGVAFCENFQGGLEYQETFELKFGSISARTTTTTPLACDHEVTLITVQTDDFAHELDWKINDECMMRSPMHNYAEFVTPCCLEDGDYVLRCLDSYGDGWMNSTIHVGEQIFCDDFWSGFSQEHSVQVANGVVTANERGCGGDGNSEYVKITLYTSSWGREVSWQITDYCMSRIEYESDSTYETFCCIPPNSILTCYDGLHDGWHGGYIEINGNRFCDDFTNGEKKVVPLNPTAITSAPRTTAITTASVTQNPAQNPCDFGKEGDLCQYDANLVASTIKFDGMSLQQFNEHADMLKELVANLLSGLGVTSGDLRWGKLLASNRRRLAGVEARLFTEVKRDTNFLNTKSALKAQSFRDGIERGVRALIGLASVDVSVVVDEMYVVIWPVTLDLTGALGTDIGIMVDGILDLAKDHANAVDRFYVEASLSGFDGISRMRFDLLGDKDVMSAQFETCDKLSSLEADIAGLNALSKCTITSYETTFGFVKCHTTTTEAPDAPIEAATTETPTTTETPEAPNQAATVDSEEEESFASGKRGVIIVILLFILLIVLLGGIFVYMYFRNDRLNKAIVTQQQQTVQDAEIRPAMYEVETRRVPERRIMPNQQFRAQPKGDTFMYGDITPVGPSTFGARIQEGNMTTMPNFGNLGGAPLQENNDVVSM